MNVKFTDHHKNPKDCQVLIALTGHPNEILKELERLTKEMAKHGKPIQCNTAKYRLESQVITPVWNGKEF